MCNLFIISQKIIIYFSINWLMASPEPDTYLIFVSLSGTFIKRFLCFTDLHVKR